MLERDQAQENQRHQRPFKRELSLRELLREMAPVQPLPALQSALKEESLSKRHQPRRSQQRKPVVQRKSPRAPRKRVARRLARDLPRSEVVLTIYDVLTLIL